MKKKLSLCVSMLLLNAVLLFSQNENHEIYLQLHGKQYENLNLRVNMDGRKIHYIPGASDNGFDWHFTLPDSIYQKHRSLDLFIPENTDTVVHQIVFNVLTESNDTLKIGSFNVAEGKTVIDARFYLTDIQEKVPFFRFKDSQADRFIVKGKEVPGLYEATQLRYSWYGYFREGQDEPAYSRQVEQYVQSTKAYPNSHMLISTFVDRLSSYKSKSDIELIFNCFSEEKKNSYFGKKVQNYLATVDFDTFRNYMLPRWDTQEIEPIVQDSTKYTLVIFSASWCAPCHKLIPLLKEIHADLKEKLDMVYVSIDEPKTVEEWKKLMHTENIPWRSVLAKDCVKEIMRQCRVNGVPCSILVSPDGRMERLEITNSKDREKLYQIP